MKSTIVAHDSFQKPDLLDEFHRMTPGELDRIAALIRAMLANTGVREAAILFLEARSVPNPAIVADCILNDAEGTA